MSNLKKPIVRFGGGGYIQCPVCGSELRSRLTVTTMAMKLELGKQDHGVTTGRIDQKVKPRTVI